MPWLCTVIIWSHSQSQFSACVEKLETGNGAATNRPIQARRWQSVSPAGDDMSVLAVLLHVHIDNPAVVLSQRLHKTTEPKKKLLMAQSNFLTSTQTALNDAHSSGRHYIAAANLIPGLPHTHTKKFFCTSREGLVMTLSSCLSTTNPVEHWSQRL